MGLQRLGIKVYTGAQGTVKETIERFIDGDLRQADPTDICQEKCH